MVPLTVLVKNKTNNTTAIVNRIPESILPIFFSIALIFTLFKSISQSNIGEENVDNQIIQLYSSILFNTTFNPSK